VLGHDDAAGIKASVRLIALGLSSIPAAATGVKA
jgi:hypothetical protein